MKLEAVIEIPKGNDRRWHLNFAKTAIEDFGPIRERIPINDGIMPVAYGYLENTKNPEEHDEVDVLVFSNRTYEIGEKTQVTSFGCINRDDGDHKILATDGTLPYEKWEDVQEEERGLILQYFGYNHVIESIASREEAEKYIAQTIVKRNGTANAIV